MTHCESVLRLSFIYVIDFLRLHALWPREPLVAEVTQQLGSYLRRRSSTFSMSPFSFGCSGCCPSIHLLRTAGWPVHFLLEARSGSLSGEGGLPLPLPTHEASPALEEERPPSLCSWHPSPGAARAIRATCPFVHRTFPALASSLKPSLTSTMLPHSCESSPLLQAVCDSPSIPGGSFFILKHGATLATELLESDHIGPSPDWEVTTFLCTQVKTR